MFKHIVNTQTLRHMLSSVRCKENRIAFCHCNSSVTKFVQPEGIYKLKVQAFSQKVNNDIITEILSRAFIKIFAAS